MLKSQQLSALRGFLRPRFVNLGLLAVLGLTLPWVEGDWARSVPSIGWALDLAVHWQWHYAILAVVSFLALGLFCGQRAWLTCLALCALPFFSATPALPVVEAGPAKFKLGSLNVNMDNAAFARTLAWVDEQQPEVLALQEVTPEMTELLAQLRMRYPHYSEAPRLGAFGSAVYSRYPVSAVTQLEGEEGAVTHFEVHWQGTVVPVSAVHPFPPVSAQAWSQRDALIRKAAERVSSRAGGVMMGDFNASPWSSGLREAKKRGLYRASGLGPTHSLWGGLAIDHILADSSSWAVAASGVGPQVGSDHRPIWADLVLTTAR